MPKYVAFLRAINVGGHAVKMDHLRRLFEAISFSNVETFIASGNVIFDSDEQAPKVLEKRVEAALKEALGYEVATFLRTTAEVADIASYKPFPESELEADGHILYIGFLGEPPAGEAQGKLRSFTSAVDEFHLDGRHLYWLARKKLGESRVSGGVLEKALGMPATFRNVSTVKRIASKYS